MDNSLSAGRAYADLCQPSRDQAAMRETTQLSEPYPLPAQVFHSMDLRRAHNHGPRDIAPAADDVDVLAAGALLDH